MMTVAAWTGGTAAQFLTHHQGQIERMCWRFGRDLPDVHDFQQDVAIEILTQYPRLRLDDARDPRAVISTWIGWKVRAVRKKAVNSRDRNRTRYVDESDELIGTMADTGPSPLQRAHMRHSVDSALALGTDKQRVAVLTVLGGYNDKELREHFGCSLNARNGRLAALKARVQRHRGRHERNAA